MSHTISDVACTVCGCVCDDLRITVEDGRITRAEGACRLAEPWFLGQGVRQPPVARIAGRSTPLEEALDHAADLLRRSRSPLVYGLSRSNTDGQREAVALADLLGATIDTTASRGHAPAVMALQEVGESTCTLGEARNSADLVVFWGSDPLESHPRHLERYSLDAPGLFCPNGRTDRFLVVADVKPTATSALADLFLPIEPGRDFEALWTLRALVHGMELDGSQPAGAPVDQLRALAERMKKCRVGVVFFGLGLSHNGHRTVEALLSLVTDLNAHARFYVRRMRVSGDVAGADSVLAWQTGFPFMVNFARGYPRYNPGEFSGQEMLAASEIDACLLVGSHGLRRFHPAAVATLQAIPTIVLDGPDAAPLLGPTVHITTAVPGVHLAGTAYRMDEVPIPLRPLLPTSYPSDARVLRALRERLTPPEKC